VKQRKSHIAGSVAFLAGFALLMPAMLRFDHSHQLLAAMLVLLLMAVALRSREAAIAACMVFLASLGDYRRYAGYFSGYPQSDPLLLVAPACVAFLLLLALVDNRIRGSSPLSLTLAAFMVVMVLQVFNPAQGSLAVGFAGALFYLVPLLWFWVGRAFGSRELLGLLLRSVVVPLGAAAAILGIYQSLYGMLPFEASWTQAVRYEALYISEDVIRPFGFFTSSAEYTRYLLLCCVIVFASWIRGRSRLVLLLPVFLVALFLASSRGPVVMFTGAAVVLWAVSARSVSAWMPRFVIAGIAGVALLALVLSGLQKASLGGRVDALLSHQVEGLLHATDTEKSTAIGHLWLGVEGVVKGLASPAGRGLGATTLGAAKYGEGIFNAEMDVSNLFYALGAVGGILYVALIVMILRRALSMWRLRRDALDLAQLGLLVVTLLAWLLGGEYSIAALLWFSIGALERASVERTAEQREKRRNAYRLGHA